jgi:hypothetical protein
MTACGNTYLSCDFGDRICRCNQTTNNWNCFDQNGDCPDMPDDGGDCTGPATACSYGDAGTCVCQQGSFNCDTGLVMCPAMRPMDGAACGMFGAGTTCDYPAGACTCMGGGRMGGMLNWSCE